MEVLRVRKVIEVALLGDAAEDKDRDEEWSDLASRREEE